MKIGVFDSGVGGLNVAEAVRVAIPESEVLFRDDKQNLPYGTKTPDELFGLVRPILQEMADEGCEAIVIACNTVTTSIIEKLREVIVVPLVGMEPMIKPAAGLTETDVIAVFATPTTLATDRYKWLKDTYAGVCNVVEPDCSTWAQMVEDNQVDRQVIKKNVDIALDAGADVIVLGCTHYHWIQDLIKELVDGKAQVIQPTGPVIEQLKRVLQQQS